MSLALDELNLSDLSKKEAVTNESPLKSPSSSRNSSPVDGVAATSKDTCSSEQHQTSNINSSNKSQAASNSCSWFFSTEKSSLLSCLLKKYLRPLGWSKKMGRLLRRPSLSIENDLFQLFAHFKDDFSLNSNGLNDAKEDSKPVWCFFLP